MLHLDLFSGIGGFAYAADQVWDDVEHIFCDNDKFCQAVLKKHWPESEIYGDIRAITDTECQRWFEGSSERSSERSGSRPQRRDKVYLLTGGFPCQPFSAAGLRLGTADERHLWPEMLRVIQLTSPEWVIAENVSGIITWNEGLVFEQVCADLEAAGYTVQPFIIPAAAVNAPHKRDRVWFIAHTNSPESPRPLRRGEAEARGISSRNRPEDSTAGQPERANRDGQFDTSDWNQDWLKVAAELCSVDDGLPVELDELKLSKAQHRAQQLKAYGNAIVPEVAMQIMKAM